MGVIMNDTLMRYKGFGLPESITTRCPRGPSEQVFVF